MINRDDKYSALGDIEEEYIDIREDRGRLFAGFWYRFQVLISLPLVIKYYIYWSITMFKNYMKITIRNIKRQKGFSFINIAGLAVGIACCIIMLLWVQEELSWDRFHENGDNIYRIIGEVQENDKALNTARTPDPLTPALKNNYPEIKNVIRYQSVDGWRIKTGEKLYMNEILAFADPEFFQMFSFEFIQGNPETVLNNKNSIIITENAAKKYFGDEDPLGKTINISYDYYVTGIIKNIPGNSHLHFDLMFPIENMVNYWSENFNDWNRIVFYSYLQLKNGSDAKNVEKKISGAIKENFPETNYNRIFLQPLRDVHLRSNFQWDLDNYGQSNISYVYIFTLTAICILLIACINFMNLSTARSGSRAREVGMRKVAGARRSDLIKQFFGESVLLSFFALLFALILAGFFLPVFNDLAGKQLSLNFSVNKGFIIGIAAVTFLTGIISGSYPAIFLSSFQPAQVLKASIFTGGGRKTILRKTLVIIQFTFTIILITGSSIIYNQLNFMRNADLGFDKDHIITFRAGPFERNLNAAKNELLKNPDILAASYSRPPTGKPWGSPEISWQGKTPENRTMMYPYSVDYDYLDTFGMKMKEGRFFSREFTSDINNYILNEAAVKAAGLDNPVGKPFSLRNREGEIIGIIKDFHQSSLHNDIEPLVLFHHRSGEGGPHINVKFKPDNVTETISHIKSVYDNFDRGNRPFSYTYLNETINNYYKSEQKIGKIFRYFTFLTVFISCLGLFGLASFMAERKTKEIGIRKVLGSSVHGIILLLTKEFVKWVVIANIVALPTAWFIMNRWLEAFAYRINISISVFLFSGILALAIAVLTVIYQAVRAAQANPVDSLKYE